MLTIRPVMGPQTVLLPILISSSITPHDTGVKLSNPQQRLFHAIESIENWLRVAPDSHVVLCDGSGFDFRPVVEERFPWAKIECLSFENNRNRIAEFGRGFGEGEIIRFALQRSKYLNQANAFAKCSSKLWVENYAECLAQFQGECLFSGVFNNAFSLTKKIEMVQVDTRFYIIDSAFYLRHFMEAHREIGKTPGFGLEDSFFSILQSLGQQRYLFSVPPVIRGVGGGTGTYYKESWHRIIKEKIRLSFVKKSPDYSGAFNIEPK